MKIVITGGHLSPALAFMDALSDSDEVVFFGRKYALEGDKALSLEYQTIEKRGIPFIPVTTGRVQRNLTRHSFSAFYKVPKGFWEARKNLKKVKADVVIGFGGYLSVPVGFAAYTLGIPVVIHEQTLEAGLANKILAKIATKICLSWDESKKFFPREKIVMTGNPVKKFQNPISPTDEPNLQFPISNEKEKPLLYVTGGSTGAHAINVLIEKALDQLVTKYRIIHQTGDSQFKDYERLSERHSQMTESLKKRYLVQKFFDKDQVGNIMTEADLVISRSGINTVSELLYFGKPSLLIPLPHGQHQEQLKNALFLQKTGLAEILLQNSITTEALISMIEKMIKEKEKYLTKTEKAKNLLVLNATDKIYEVLSYVVKKKNA